MVDKQKRIEIETKIVLLSLFIVWIKYLEQYHLFSVIHSCWNISIVHAFHSFLHNVYCCIILDKALVILLFTMNTIFRIPMNAHRPRVLAFLFNICLHSLLSNKLYIFGVCLVVINEAISWSWTLRNFPTLSIKSICQYTLASDSHSNRVKSTDRHMNRSCTDCFTNANRS